MIQIKLYIILNIKTWISYIYLEFCYNVMMLMEITHKDLLYYISQYIFKYKI